MKIPTEDQAIAAIRELLDYNWSDEENDYAECLLGNGNDPDGHIFEKMKLIQCWLDTRLMA